LKGPQLGAIAIKEAVNRAGIEPGDVEDVIFGHVLQGGVGQAPARQAAMGAGIPATVPAVTINKVCGSRDGVKFGNNKMVDGLIHDGLWCGFYDCHMGGHAEYTAMKAGVSREDQDKFAYESQMKASAAIEAGKFDAETVAVEVPGRKGQVTVVDKDENPRADTTLEALAKLRPVFGDSAPKEVTEYTVTAGNASALNDGAAALVVTSQGFAEERGLEIKAFIRNYSVGATEPQDLFFAPIHAVQKLMEKDGTSIGDYDLIEANEAFAAQAVADGRALGWDWDRVNVNGGAVALGHPIGASGARILVTLLGAMEARDAKLGLATLCLGGGNAVAVSVERA
jgi:acetyl-CoA C-acetyltransferase